MTRDVPKKLVRNMRDPASRAYWEATLATAALVRTWPAWKRGMPMDRVEPSAATTRGESPE